MGRDVGQTTCRFYSIRQVVGGQVVGGQVVGGQVVGGQVIGGQVAVVPIILGGSEGTLRYVNS
jgi:hypothetical protein